MLPWRVLNVEISLCCGSTGVHCGPPGHAYRFHCWRGYADPVALRGIRSDGRAAEFLAKLTTLGEVSQRRAAQFGCLGTQCFECGLFWRQFESWDLGVVLTHGVLCVFGYPASETRVGLPMGSEQPFFPAALFRTLRSFFVGGRDQP